MENQEGQYNRDSKLEKNLDIDAEPDDESDNKSKNNLPAEYNPTDPGPDVEKDIRPGFKAANDGRNLSDMERTRKEYDAVLVFAEKDEDIAAELMEEFTTFQLSDRSNVKVELYDHPVFGATITERPSIICEKSSFIFIVETENTEEDLIAEFTKDETIAHIHYISKFSDAVRVLKNNDEALRKGLLPIKGLAAADPIEWRSEDESAKKNLIKLFDDQRTAEERQCNASVEIYQTAPETKGFCLIINNFKFSHDNLNRPSAEWENDYLEALFKEMNYEVWNKKNLTASEIKTLVKDISKMDHARYDSFVCFLLSHGHKGCIYSFDVKNVPLRNIFNCFLPIPTLHRKPKLFFIDAGRTIEENSTQATFESDDFTDFYICYATSTGEQAGFDKQTGDWFTNEFIEALKERSTSCDLVDIIRQVKNQLSKRSWADTPKPDVIDRLPKIFFFPRKHSLKREARTDYHKDQSTTQAFEADVGPHGCKATSDECIETENITPVTDPVVESDTACGDAGTNVGRKEYDAVLVFGSEDSKKAGGLLFKFNSLKLRDGSNARVVLFDNPVFAPNIIQRPFELCKKSSFIFIVNTEHTTNDWIAQFTKDESIAQTRLINLLHKSDSVRSLSDADEVDLSPMRGDIARISWRPWNESAKKNMTNLFQFQRDEEKRRADLTVERHLFDNLHSKFVDEKEFLSFAENEGKALKDLFEKMRYEVKDYPNVESTKMKQLIDDLVKEDHGQYDSVICFLQSHGKSDVIFGSDSQHINLLPIFDQLHCEKLKGKPKIIFIQSCRTPFKSTAEREHVDDVRRRFGETQYPDFYICYATSPGEQSMYDKENGSWFTCELIDALKKPKGSDIVGIMGHVEHQLASKRRLYKQDGQVWTQKPDIIDTLSKRFFFEKPD